jgi:hypothetical protein
MSPLWTFLNNASPNTSFSAFTKSNLPKKPITKHLAAKIPFALFFRHGIDERCLSLKKGRKYEQKIFCRFVGSAFSDAGF